MMIINNEYEIGEVVYLKTDHEQRERLVISIQVREGGSLCYQLNQGGATSWHVDFEMTKEKDFVKSTKD